MVRIAHAVPHLALFAAMFVWSCSFIALKVGLSGMTPVEVMAGRMTVGTLIFLPCLPRLWRALREHGRVKALLVMVFCEPCLYFLFEIYALRYTSASQAGMVVAMLPLCVALAAWGILRERVQPRVLAGFTMALVGVIWLSLDAVTTDNAPHPVLGNFLEACAMCCATGYTISIKRLTSTYTPLQLTAFQSVAGMCFFVPMLLLPIPGQPLPLDMNLPSWAPMAAVVFLGAGVTLGGYGLYNYGLSRLPAGQASAYTNLIPVMTLFLGVFLLHEVFLPAQYVASALVVAGVLLSQQGGSASAPRK